MQHSGDDGNENSGKDEDESLWAYVTKDIEPLPEKEPPVARPVSKTRAAKDNKPKRSPPPQPKPHTPQSREVDRRTAQRLRRGQMAVEARLDLHGMNRHEAHEALQNFLLRCHRQGLRHVLVITGKGRRSGGGLKPGILRQAVPEWLDEEPLRAIVLQIHSARPQHGGEGAFYILLRRKR